MLSLFFFRIFFFFFKMCMHVLPSWMSVHHMRTVPVQVRGFSRPGAADSSELSGGCWELTLDLWKSTGALNLEATFQTHKCFLKEPLTKWGKLLCIPS